MIQAVRLAFIVGISLLGFSIGDENNHIYTTGEEVHLWLNKVGPYHNPQETYSYYSLPFCKPVGVAEFKRGTSGIGEILGGNELRSSGIEVKFNENKETDRLCSVTLDEEQADTFAFAVSNHYCYQMYLDYLPIYAMVGEIYDTEEYVREMELHKDIPHKKADQTLVYTHKSFSISYNYDRIIEVNLTSENPQPVHPGATLDFTYSVHWNPTAKSFESRFDRYLDDSFFEHQIHWFSIFNAFMMVLFLCGLVALILIRTLRNDYAKYMNDEEDGGMGEESGWKLVHGEVFRQPSWPMLFAALLGTGAQLVTGSACAIVFAVAGTLYAERGGMLTAFIVAYALSSIVGGYVSGGYYKQQFYPNPAKSWVKALFLTVSLLPMIVFTVIFALNCIAIYYETVNTIPFAVVLKVLAIWLFVAVPLAIAGTIVGRQLNGVKNAPCRVHVVPRKIPDGEWYTKPAFIIPVTGLLPFGSIFLETYYIFTSFWTYKVYYVYGFMGLVFVILCIVSVCCTIVAVYFLLNAEDPRWQWVSFMSSASTAIYVLLYSIYYYFVKTHMTGFFQAAFYTGYSFLLCVGLAFMCGFIGWFGSSFFVYRVFRNIKVD